MGVFSVSKYLGEDSVKEVNKNSEKKALDVAVIHPLRQPKCTSLLHFHHCYAYILELHPGLYAGPNYYTSFGGHMDVNC